MVQFRDPAAHPETEENKHQNRVMETSHMLYLMVLVKLWSRQWWDHLSVVVQSVNSLSCVILSADLRALQPQQESRRTQWKQTHLSSLINHSDTHECVWKCRYKEVRTHCQTSQNLLRTPKQKIQRAEQRHLSLPRHSVHFRWLWLYIIHSHTG